MVAQVYDFTWKADADIFCDIYACYSELLQSLQLEDVVFEQLEVSADKKSIKTHPVDPLLFLYFLACGETEANEFEKFFSPLGIMIYSESYNE